MPRSKPGPKGKTNRSLTGAAPSFPAPAAAAYLNESEAARFREIIAQIGHRYRPGMEYDAESLAIALSLRGTAAETLRKEGLIVEGSKGSKVKHPAYEILRDAQGDIARLTSALGLVRRERSDRIKDAKPASNDVEKVKPDPLAAALEEQLG
jgi:P27 family predicted phage terminase small subunit